MDRKQKTGKAEVIIESIVGCGRFQVIVTICLLFMANISPIFTMLFMAFGGYNPGWRCNDYSYSNTSFQTSNITVTIIGNQNFSQVTESVRSGLAVMQSESNIQDNKDIVIRENSFEYHHLENCQLFESCNHVEFNPASSTIVSEWGLLCNKKWIPSIIISIQMAGVFVGSLLSGHLGDAFGRKPVIYGSLLATVCLNIVSSFSVSWEMFAAIRFFLGISCALEMCLYYVFVAEFVPQKWRSVVIGIPAWSINSTIWALTCMALKNWRHIHIVIVILGVVGVLPVAWIPESLRWLEVKMRSADFKRAGDKIARTNRKQLPSLESLQEMADSRTKSKAIGTQKKYNFFHLFKNGYAKYTIMITLPWFTSVAFLYALEFGIKALRGHFYINLLVSPLLTIPLSLFPIFLPNLVGRKMATLIFGGAITICLLGAAILELVKTSESVKSIGVPALVFIAKSCLDAMWCTLAIFTMELYPTVVRGIVTSWGSTVGRVGSIVAPFLSPDHSHGAYISYAIMATLMFISCGILLGLPETKGLALKDTMNVIDSKEDRTCDSNNDKGSLDNEQINL